MEIFSSVGAIVDAYLPMDRITGQPRGFAFLTYANAEEAAAAIERFDGFELEGRTLRVNEAEARPQDSRGPRGGGGGGVGGGGGGYDGGGEHRERHYRSADRKPRSGNKPKGSRRGLRRKKRSI